MRELTYFVATSLDGYIAAPDGDYSVFPVAGDHIEMIARDYADTLPTPALAHIGIEADGSRFDTVLMGWSTYAVGLPHGLDDPYPHLRQYVVSRQPRDLPPGITQVDDPLATVRELKAETGGTGIWLCGGGQLATAIADEIDRLVLKVNPLVLGDGIPLFAGAGGAARDFTLERSTPYTSGVVVSEYARTAAA